MHVRLKNEFTDDEKYNNLIRWLISLQGRTGQCLTLFIPYVMQQVACLVVNPIRDNNFTSFSTDCSKAVVWTLFDFSTFFSYGFNFHLMFFFRILRYPYFTVSALPLCAREGLRSLIVALPQDLFIVFFACFFYSKLARLAQHKNLMQKRRTTGPWATMAYLSEQL